MVYLDFRSLRLIIVMWRSGRGSGHAWSRTALDLRSMSLIDTIWRVGRGSGGRHLVPSLDLRSLCLIIAMRRSGRGSGRHLVPHSLRFTLTEPHRHHAARGPAAADSRKAVNAAAGRGGGHRWGGVGRAQMGRGGEV